MPLVKKAGLDGWQTVSYFGNGRMQKLWEALVLEFVKNSKFDIRIQIRPLPTTTSKEPTISLGDEARLVESLKDPKFRRKLEKAFLKNVAVVKDRQGKDSIGESTV